MPSYHAQLSPSSADRWTSCTASINAQAGIPNVGNAASREGTCCHQIQAECLTDAGLDPHDYVGREMAFWNSKKDGSGEDWEDLGLPVKCEIARVTVSEQMADAVASALGFICKVHEAIGGRMEVEQRVPIGQFTGEEDAGGTSDTTIIGDDWVWVGDSKYGRMKVMAYEILMPAGEDLITGEMTPEVARANLQMASYALGSIEKFGLRGKCKTVTLVIIQPMIAHVSEYTCSIDELIALEAWLRGKANETRDNPQYVPSADNCHFCRASGNCDAQTRAVYDAAVAGFDEVTKTVRGPMLLGQRYALIPLVMDWAEATATRVRSELQAGNTVLRDDGLTYRFAEGKNGARQWVSEEEAERLMEAMRLKSEVMYKPRKLISPTDAEVLSKSKRAKKGQEPIPPVLGPTQWNRLLKNITQERCAPVIVLETDPRPKLAAAADGFEDVVDEGVMPNVDLF